MVCALWRRPLEIVPLISPDCPVRFTKSAGFQSLEEIAATSLIV